MKILGAGARFDTEHRTKQIRRLDQRFQFDHQK